MGEENLKNIDLLLKEMQRVDNERHEWMYLCGEILATISIEGNKIYFDNMPNHWHELVKRWRSMSNKLKGIVDKNSLCVTKKKDQS